MAGGLSDNMIKVNVLPVVHEAEGVDVGRLTQTPKSGPAAQGNCFYYPDASVICEPNAQEDLPGQAPPSSKSFREICRIWGEKKEAFLTIRLSRFHPHRTG